MITLGINEDHNATAAILKDGKVIYCASEERITRKKNDVGYPLQAINEALKETGLRPDNIDFVAISAKHQDPLVLKVKRATLFKTSDFVDEMNQHWKKILLENKKSYFWEKILQNPKFEDKKHQYYDFTFLKSKPKSTWDKIFDLERVNVVTRHIGVEKENVILVDHHLSHASYAYYASPINRTRKTAVITADGWGDGKNASIYLGQNGKLEKVHETAMCNLARIYRYITLILGMRPYEHEYKVMGLAPYAKEYYYKPVYEIFKDTLVVDGIDFKWNNKPKDLYFHFKNRFEGLRFDGIAGGLQKWLEEILVEWITNIVEHLNVDQVVYSGGLSLNVKANKAISAIPKIKHFFVPPSGGDESSTIGAAYWVSLQKGATPVALSQAYLGYKVTTHEVDQLISKNNIRKKFSIIEQPSNYQVAKLLAAGKVIARCVGPMEFGARALGNRSILADPSKFENVAKLNDKIKQRDFWMPFTPSILDRREKDYLKNPKKVASPFMTVGFATTPKAKKDLCAAIHPADGSARPQILSFDQNPKYYKLIEAFEKLTGIGSLLNTSFNLHGEPIVRNAKDAYYTFINSDIDGLLFEHKLILKTSN